MTRLLAVGAADVHRLLPMDRCIELMADALLGLARGDALNPLRAAYRRPRRNKFLASQGRRGRRLTPHRQGGSSSGT